MCSTYKRVSILEAVEKVFKICIINRGRRNLKKESHSTPNIRIKLWNFNVKIEFRVNIVLSFCLRLPVPTYLLNESILTTHNNRFHRKYYLSLKNSQKKCTWASHLRKNQLNGINVIIRVFVKLYVTFAFDCIIKIRSTFFSNDNLQTVSIYSQSN